MSLLWKGRLNMAIAKRKKSPYTIFNDWLFSSLPNAEFPIEVLKAINKRSILASLGKLDGVTIFLNEYFNNFGTMAFDDIEFYTFVRALIKKHRVKKFDLSFYKHEKINKNLKELQRDFPYLKRLEIGMFMELVKEDPEYDDFAESIGIAKKTRQRKTTKADKKAIEKRRAVEKEEVITFEGWLKNFNQTIKNDAGVCYQEVT